MLLYAELRDWSLQTLRGTSAITPILETQVGLMPSAKSSKLTSVNQFVLYGAMTLCRMGEPNDRMTSDYAGADQPIQDVKYLQLTLSRTGALRMPRSRSSLSVARLFPTMAPRQVSTGMPTGTDMKGARLPVTAIDLARSTDAGLPSLCRRERGMIVSKRAWYYADITFPAQSSWTSQVRCRRDRVRLSRSKSRRLCKLRKSRRKDSNAYSRR